ncbi:MAG: ABC transporter ATP-binding protein [Patescibacteria group bacterium]
MTSKNINMPKAGVSDVLRAIWRGIYPRRWLFLFVLVVFVGGSIVQLLIPLLYKQFFDLLTSGGDKILAAKGLVHAIVLILGLNLTGWLLQRTGMLAINDFESKTIVRLKQLSFEYLINHSYSFFSNNFTGSLVQRINRFSRSFEVLTDHLVFNFVPLLINVFGVILVLWLQQPNIAYIIMGWVVCTVTFNFLFSRWKVKYDIKSAAADSTTTAVLSDDITNQNTILSFTGSKHEVESFRKVSNDQAQAMRLTWDLGVVADAVQGAFIIAMEFLIFYYTIRFWQRDAITVGTFVLIQAYILGLGQRLWNLSSIVRNVYQGYADSKEMVEIMMLPHEVQDIPSAKLLVVRRGEVQLKDLTFNFNDTRSVLSGINLSIAGGEKIALIGPSGAGKSTLVKLLLRMYNLTSGTILIDGQDVQRVTQVSLRENISLVPQDPILFHRSLMENIRYGRRDATDQEVFEAAKLAHCDEFIEPLPLKYETFVGERGIKLSGGERQRVAIARAILKNAPILVLDEATSSLDSHSESLIRDALDKLMEGKTTIVIAHRLSTIRKMDRIVVVDGGKITEEGTHESLLAKEGSLYKHLWDLQAGGFITE